MSAAKALQVGATIAKKSFAVEEGTISSTWGGGHTLDLALGLETIRTIKKEKLLSHITKMGNYTKKRLYELHNDNITNIRGKGLMLAFDASSTKNRNNLVIECVKQGLVVLGCGNQGIRLIPPYIVTEKEIDQAVDILENVTKNIAKKNFKHTGSICNYLTCNKH